MADVIRAVVPIIPAPPRPPDNPDPTNLRNYTNELTRWLENLSRQVGGITYLRGGSLYLAPESFPTSGDGLKPGEVFSNDGVLTWVRPGDIWLGDFSLSAELGTLTVTV